MDLSQLERVFGQLGATESAPENHGILCGLLCARGEVTPPEWLAVAAGAARVGTDGAAPLEAGTPARSLVVAETDAGALRALYEDTVSHLQSAEGLFVPLLPDDEESLPARSVAMAEWCGGFLYGLAAGGIEDLSVLPADVQEVAGDLAEISRAGVGEEGDEEDEAAYAELVEYLRAGVTLVYEILEAERGGASAGGRTIH